MTTFDNREKAFENKYAYDQETQFKIAARRNKLLGTWAAEHLNLTGAEAESYARDVVSADLEEVGEEDVFRKVYEDLRKGGVRVSEQDVRKKMRDLFEVARTQVAPKP